MGLKARTSAVLLLVFLASRGLAAGETETRFPTGAGCEGGIGFLAIRDEHISGAKYRGPWSWFAVKWRGFSETWGFDLGLIYQTSSHLRNENVSAEISQGELHLAVLYGVGSLELFGKHAALLIGPETGALIHWRSQKVAINSDAEPDIYQSGIWLLWLGGKAEALLPLTDHFRLEGVLQIGLLGLGGSAGSSQVGGGGVTLLTLLSGARGAAGLGMRYAPLSWLSLKASYRLEVVRIDSWTEFLEASDNGSLEVEFHF